jgi:iron complex outermembrane receptor protein
MNRTLLPHSVRWLASVPLLSLLTVALSAQDTATATDKKDEPVQLSVFQVSGSQPARYQSDEAVSGGRIRQNIMDSSSSIVAITRALIDDTGAGRVLDSARYVAGITDATIPNALDRITIRGFQSDGRRLDGFTFEGQSNYDTAAIERIEVIKGPNALLLPSGTPGGTINQVSKVPLFHQQGYVTVQGGRWDSNKAEADVTGPIGDSRQLAYRVVTSYQDNKGFVDRSYRDSILVSPSLTWKPAPDAQITVRLEHYNFRASSSTGLPVNTATVGTNTGFSTFPGMPLDFSPNLLGEYREERSNTATLLFTAKISDHISVRLAGRASQVSGPTFGGGYGLSSAGGAYDPNTGLWTPGIVYGPAPTFTPSPATPTTTVFSHTGTYQTNIYRREDLQNDYVFDYEFPQVKTTTVAGLAYGYFSNNRVSANYTAQKFDITNFTIDTAPVIMAPVNTDQQLRYHQMQTYVTESLDLFKNRVILNGGVANFSFNGYIVNKIGTGTPYTPGTGDANTVNYGIVVKPIHNVAIYYGHTENAAPATSFNQVATGAVPPFSRGTNNEIGVKVQLLEGRLFAMVDHYDITQTAYALANPLNNTSPPPPVLLPAIYSTRKAKGWEYQLTAALTKQLSVIANYTNFKNRDPNNVPFRAGAEKSGGIYTRYEFTEGRFRGFAAAVGVNYMDKRPGDAASGYAAGSTPTVLIPNQPSFYLPAQTLTDLNFSYTRGHSTYRLNVFNVFDKTNWVGGGSRTANNPGNPRNYSASVTYRF